MNRINNYPTTAEPRTFDIDVAAGFPPRRSAYRQPLTNAELLRQRMMDAWSLSAAAPQFAEEAEENLSSVNPDVQPDRKHQLAHRAGSVVVDSLARGTTGVGNEIGAVAFTLFNDGQTPPAPAEYAPVRPMQPQIPERAIPEMAGSLALAA